MSKADSIKDIRFKLRKLCDITDELVENLAKLHDSVHNGSFISEALNQKMTGSLRSISQLQTEIFQEYTSLEIGDLPDYIEEMETVLKLDPVVGSEQGGIRPVIVIQNDTGNKHAPTLIVATVTTRIHKKANMPTHFVIYDNPAFKEASVVQLEQIRTIDKSRIDNYLGKVTPREMVAIEKALSVSLAMEQLKKRSPKHKAKRAKE